MDDIVSKLRMQYPAIADYPWSVIDSRGKGGDDRQLEFYHPDEVDNPAPGNPTIEVFNPKLQGPALEQAVLGDMLHYLPYVDQGWAGMRDRFSKSLTGDQLNVDHQAYRESGDERSFPDWMKQSRLDAYIRGHITPDTNDEWRGVYNPQQLSILNEMQQYLRNPRR